MNEDKLNLAEESKLNEPGPQEAKA
jgi:predicted transcriptional regulator